MDELRDQLLQALADREGLGPWLDVQLAAAREAWPKLSFAPRELAAFLAPKISAAESLEALHGKDLLLAGAAHHRDPLALSALHQLCRKVVEREAARTRATGLEDDALQAVEQLLLTRTAKREEAIAQYSGKGELAAFIRVIAVRELLRLKKGEPDAQGEAEQEELEQLAAPVSSPELGLLRGRYRDAFRDAFREAIEALPGKERMLLRQHFLDGLSLDALAKLNQVHRATIARWLAQARATLAELTREKLKNHISQRTAELESVLDVVGSQLDVSLGALLKTMRP